MKDSSRPKGGWRRGRVVLGIAALALAGVSALVAGSSSTPAPGAELPLPLVRTDGSEKLPDYVFEQRGADGGIHERGFADYRGRPVVATAWATWCGVCRVEMPKLDAVAEEMQSSGLVVLAVSIDDGGLPVAERALRERGLPNLRTVHDTQKMFFSAIGAFGVPTTVIADAEGRIVARASGAVAWDAPEVRAFLRSLTRPAAKS